MEHALLSMLLQHVNVTKVGQARLVILVLQDITAPHVLVSLQRLLENWSNKRLAGPSNCTIWDDGYTGTGKCIGTATSSSDSVSHSLLLLSVG